NVRLGRARGAAPCYAGFLARHGWHPLQYQVVRGALGCGGGTVPRKKVIDELTVVKLLKQAKGELDDPIQVNRLLREVGKFYDPMTGKAMIDGASRAQVIALIERGERAEALAAIDQYIENYQKRVEPDSSQTPSPEQHPHPTA
ncbi:MAG: hypothetical protein HW385_1001, partial [candidate division NC10 bacterium]|nr:hypothetical protein [candidate division NC10 bacterium]